MNIKKRDKKYLGRDASLPLVEIVGAKGSFLYGPRGKKYIDFLTGWNVGNADFLKSPLVAQKLFSIKHILTSVSSLIYNQNN